MKYTQSVHESDLKMVTSRAQLIAESLGIMHYDAMGIGDDDLALGKDFLIELSKKAKFPFLSSNLVDAGTGKPIFHSTLIKEVNGLKIGMFSLLSPDIFTGPQDPRLKGLILENPTETANRIVKELKPKTDLILLLSHLGYPKDVELAQTVSGIQVIVGSHTGMSLLYPATIKDTVILHTPPKGMYAGRFDLAFTRGTSGFYNSATKRSMERNLTNLKLRLGTKEGPKTEKESMQKMIGDMERSLKQFDGKNEFSNAILPLSGRIQDQPEILKLIELFKANFPE